MEEITHDYAEIELLYNNFTEPAVKKSLKKLKKELPENPRILDAGCGPGSHFELFNEIFNDAKVTAVDISEPHLKEASEKAENLEISIDVVKSDLTRELDIGDDFDLIWLGDVICPSDIEDPTGLISNMKKYLNSEGVLAVFYGNWLRQTFLPGYARLEHKINAAYELMHETKNLGRPWQGPDHPEKALKWLKQAGLYNNRQKFFTATHNYPLDKEVQKYVQRVFENDYSQAITHKGEEVGLTEKEGEKWRKISDPENILFLPDKETYFCSMNCMLAYGHKREVEV